MSNFYAQTVQEVFKRVNSNEHGLDKKEAEKRLLEFGANKFAEAKTDSLFTIFINQFKSPLIYILFVASIIMFLIGEKIDAYVIFFILLFNSVIGTLQEGKAQNTLRALKNLVETKATVLRDGQEIIIPDFEVVSGDIIILQEGEKISADARVIFSSNLKVDEAVLTGESVPVHKISEKISDKKISLGDQENIVFKGTNIVFGNGKAVVIATGMNTEVGKISKEMSMIDTEIPLKTNIRNLSKVLVTITVCICAFLFLFGMFLGKPITEMFSLAVSLSVAIIPEGLPVVLTLVLASGVWRMSKKNALVKKLQAVEALGQARVIALDKTGTITKNEMVVKKVYIDNNFFDISGSGYDPKGEILFNKEIINKNSHPELLLIGKIATFCANARVMFSKEDNVWRVAGDPTEAAMLVFGEKLGFQKGNMLNEFPLVEETPFDYKSKYHATLNGEKEKFFSIVGAPEVIFKLCKKIYLNNKDQVFSKEEKEKLESIFVSMSKEGLRVIALAKNDSSLNYNDNNNTENLDPENMESLTFVGFLGIQDAIRPEVFDAVRKANNAGIKVVMITGDNKITAESIAKEIGVYKDGNNILSGVEIDVLSDEELSEKLNDTTVFARVSPSHKLRIIMAYKKRGEIIAMTGDGVNDAPSLIAADLGVAMGKIGTEVAKEASDIILLDDNFGNIISAVEEGRNIYKTIKKVLLYLFSTNLGEVLIIICALFLGFPLPILAAQIIWVNFVTDSFLDVSLAMEPKEKNLLYSSFERPKKYLIDKIMTLRIFSMSVPMVIGTLFVFSKYLEQDFTKALTMSFTTMVVFQWFNAFNCRHETKSIFRMNLFSNRYLVGGILIVIFLQLIAVYTPFLQKILQTVPLTLFDWILIISVSSSIIFIEEIRKIFYRRKNMLVS
ncbi:MAG: HAD-IC family P-type ATPase [Patescibacteria group bacterium]